MKMSQNPRSVSDMKMAHDLLITARELDVVESIGGYKFAMVLMEKAQPEYWEGRRWSDAISALEESGAFYWAGPVFGPLGRVRLPVSHIMVRNVRGETQRVVNWNARRRNRR